MDSDDWGAEREKHFLGGRGRANSKTELEEQGGGGAMGGTISTLVFQPPPATFLHNKKHFWLQTRNQHRIPVFHVERRCARCVRCSSPSLLSVRFLGTQDVEGLAEATNCVRAAAVFTILVGFSHNHGPAADSLFWLIGSRTGRAVRCLYMSRSAVFGGSLCLLSRKTYSLAAV